MPCAGGTPHATRAMDFAQSLHAARNKLHRAAAPLICIKAAASD